MTEKKVLILLSEKSSSETDIRKDAISILKSHDIVPTFLDIAIPPDIYHIKRTEIELYTAVFVYGGDGTVVTAIKHLKDCRVPLVIIPGGTGNLIAKYLGIKANYQKILADYAKGLLVAHYFDIAESNDGLLSLDIHIGWWAESTISTPRSLKKRIGIVAYGIQAIRKLPKQSRQMYQFKIDGGDTKTVHAYTSLFANKAIQNFFGFKLFNKTERSSTLEIAFITSLNPLRFWVWVLGRILSGRNIGGFIKTYYARTIKILHSPELVLFDDEERSIKHPTIITAGAGQTKLLVPSRRLKTNALSRSLRKLVIIALTVLEQVRNTISGAPLYKYSQVMPKLYVGGSFRKKATKEFEAWGIRAIVNMRRVPDPKLNDSYIGIHLPTTDLHAPTLDNLKAGVDFIQSQIKQGNGVFIHCRHGRGRGPTMAAAYLIYDYGMTTKQAINHLKTMRPMVDILGVQKKRLIEYELLLKKNSV